LDRIITTDFFGYRIQIFDSSGNFINKFGSEGSAPGQFLNPIRVTVDSSDRIIIADARNHRVQIFDSSGTFYNAFGTGGSDTSQFDMPVGVGVDNSDQIVVADTGNDRIQVFDSFGNLVTVFGSSGTATGQFQSPTGVAVDNSDQIVVADTGNDRIQVFDSFGNFVTVFGSSGTATGQFQSPTGVAVDNSDQIVVTDVFNNRIQIFGSSGTAVTSEALLNNPKGVAVDSLNRIIVADSGNDRIQIFLDSSTVVAPIQVTDLAYTVISKNQIDLNWSIPDNGSPIQGYLIERTIIGKGDTTLETSFGGLTTTSYSDTKLSSGNEVQYRIRALNSQGYGPQSNIPPAVTTTAFPPFAIGDLALVVSSDTQVDLSWTTPPSGGPPITGYIIERKLNGGTIDSLESSFGDATTTSYSDTTLSLGDSVTYRVRAVNSIGPAPFSNIPPNVVTAILVPDSVTDLSLILSSSTKVDMSWTIPADNGSPITGYLIQRNLNSGGAETLETSFGDATTTSYSDTTLSPGDAVTYRVAAINAGGTALLSNIPPNVVTPIPVPDSVTDLSLTVISGNQVDLSWTIPADNGSPITGYLIERNLNGGTIATLEISFGDATTTSYSDTTLSPGDAVTYRVAAINAVGTALLSNVPPHVVTS